MKNIVPLLSRLKGVTFLLQKSHLKTMMKALGILLDSESATEVLHFARLKICHASMPEVTFWSYQ